MSFIYICTNCFKVCHINRTTTIILRPFIWVSPGEPVPEDTFTHHGHGHHQLPRSTTIHNILNMIGPILWGHSSPVCHALSLWTSILHCHSPGVATVTCHLRYSYSWLQLILVVVSTVATPGEWQCKIRTGSVRRLAVANGPNIFQMLLVIEVF